MKRLFFAFSLILIILLSHSSSHSNYGLITPVKEVLIIQSYERDYVHTRDVEEGIESYFSKGTDVVRFRYEFLDTKNYYDEKAFEMLASIYSKKYSHRPLDGVILVDDDALKFYLQYKSILFRKDTPVVATGINSLKGYPTDIPFLTILEEKPNYKKNIEIALKQNNTIKSLHFIYDTTTTSDQVMYEIQTITEESFMQYEVYHHNTAFPDEIKALVDQASDTDLFFFVLYSRDPNNTPYHYAEVPSFVIENAKRPVYVFWEFYLGTGVLGGHVASSYKYGEEAARILEKYWSGTVVSPVIYESGDRQEYVFDYNVLKKYQIEYIPPSSKILFKPLNYFERNKTLIFIFLIITCLLIGVIGLLSYALHQRKNALIEHKKVQILNREIIETQKDLLSRLGDVIETRSKETASHVKRVSAMSYFLAKKYGLSDQEATTLATISPMHDIGKIGISENILHKPGRLTKEEFEIMQFHTNLGYDILKNSNKEMMHLASIIALEHHEKWDGTGYPSGKKNTEIHVFSRITCVADVYDALRSDRIYKQAWSIEDTLNYFKEEHGKSFEPILVDILLENIREIEYIRENATVEESL